MWLQKEGLWKSIIVDDQVPVIQTSEGVALACSQTQSGQLWPTILEKAYAKLWGGWKSVRDGNAVHTVRDLTGSPYTLQKDLSDSDFI